MQKTFRVFTTIISILSLLCLFYIFVLDDFIQASRQADVMKAIPESTAEPELTYTLNVPESVLIYDGSSSLDLMSGITATDSKGTDRTDAVTYAIKAGDSVSQKTIEYTLLIDGTAAASAERALTLENYEGPKLTVADRLTLHAGEAQSLLNTLFASGSIFAEDGFGTPITDTVAYQSSSDLSQAGEYPVTFTVTNFLNDSYSIQSIITITGSLTDPVVTLNTNAVTLPVGSEFNWRRYFESAVDPVDGDISHRLHVEQNVDVNTPGTYTVTYTAKNYEGVSSAPVILTVTITE